MKKDVIPADEYAGLHGEIVSVVESARLTAVWSVNAVMTAAYWFNEAEALGANSTPAQEDTPETTVGAHTRQKRGHRKPLDPNLPREVVRQELPEADRFCANDGHALVEIGVETSEQLDVIPEQLRVIQHQRVKYACPCCDLGIKVTPAPPRIIPRGLLTESALAWIAT
jgi:hypothetical protein